MDLLRPLLVRSLMGRVKLLVVRMEVDAAVRAHECRSSSKHKIKKGDVRLKVRNGRSWMHYCRACADLMIGKSIEKLVEIRRMEPDSGEASSEKALPRDIVRSGTEA